MTDFVYDGSFDGFLTAVERALAERDARVVPLGAQAADLFAGTVSVATDDDAAGRVRRRLGSAAGADELDTLLLVHSSADPDRHRLLISYIRLTLRAGRSIAAEIGRPDVLAVRKIRDRVSLEMSRVLGFVRLRQVSGRLYYAPLAPDADIAGLIGPHFAERFPDQALILHDTRRGIAFWADGAARGLLDMRSLPEGWPGDWRRTVTPLSKLRGGCTSAGSRIPSAAIRACSAGSCLPAIGAPWSSSPP